MGIGMGSDLDEPIPDATDPAGNFTQYDPMRFGGTFGATSHSYGGQQVGPSSSEQMVDRYRGMAADSNRPAYQINYGGALANEAQANEARDDQHGALWGLRDAANGAAPSRAVTEGSQVAGNSLESAMQANAGARGPNRANPLLAMAQQQQQQLNGTTAAMGGRSKEMQGAIAAYGAGSNAMNAQDHAAQELAAKRAIAQGKIEADQRGMNDTRALGFERDAVNTRKADASGVLTKQELAAQRDQASAKAAADKEQADKQATMDAATWGFRTAGKVFSDERTMDKKPGLLAVADTNEDVAPVRQPTSFVRESGAAFPGVEWGAEKGSEIGQRLRGLIPQSIRQKGHDAIAAYGDFMTKEHHAPLDAESRKLTGGMLKASEGVESAVRHVSPSYAQDRELTELQQKIAAAKEQLESNKETLATKQAPAPEQSVSDEKAKNKASGYENTNVRSLGVESKDGGDTTLEWDGGTKGRGHSRDVVLGETRAGGEGSSGEARLGGTTGGKVNMADAERSRAEAIAARKAADSAARPTPGARKRTPEELQQQANAMLQGQQEQSSAQLGSGPSVRDIHDPPKWLDDYMTSDEGAKKKRGNSLIEIQKGANRALRGETYTYKEGFGEDPNQVHHGFMAQNLEKNPITATAIREDGSGLKKVDNTDALRVTAAGVASLQDQHDELEKALQALATRRGKKRSA